MGENLEGSPETPIVVPVWSPDSTMVPLAVRIDGELAVSLMIALRPEVGSTTNILPPGPSTLKKLDAPLPNAMYIPPVLMAAPRLEPASPCVPSASAETSLKCGDEDR